MMNFQRETRKPLELEVQINAKNKSRTSVACCLNFETHFDMFLVHNVFSQNIITRTADLFFGGGLS
jgi:hypothetical protein